MQTAAADTFARLEAFKERLTPALDVLDEKVRDGKRAFVRGQHAAEDAVAAAALTIRRRPFGTVMMAAGAGALAGGLIGFALGWVRCRRD